jgi:hypothetical protein
MLDSFHRVLVGERSFRLSIGQVLIQRLQYFWQVFYSKILPGHSNFTAIITFLSLFSIFSSSKKLMRDCVIPIFIIFLLTPMVFYILFQGNFGNIFDYYMSGYYLPMILFFSIGIGEFMKNSLTKLLVLIFIITFLYVNISMLKSYLTSDVNGENTITLINQIKAVDYVLEDGSNYGEFNVDFYVPPVTPYAYDYLLSWHGYKKCGENLCGLKKSKQTDIFYTPYEVDNFHPDRLSDWLNKKDLEGILEMEKRFGGITVQKRNRY